MESVFGFFTWAKESSWTFVAAQGPEFFMSVTAIFLAMLSGRQSAKHSGLSVVPAFAAWADYPRDANTQCEIRLSNKGFGPAIIDETLVFYRGKRFKRFQFESIEAAINEAFGKYLENCHKAATGQRGHAVGVNETIVLAGFEVKPELNELGAEKFGEMLKPMTLTIKYRDIYRRKWLFIIKEFEGHTLRVNSPRYFLWDRFRFRGYLG